jgi:hypothetical protein
MQNTRTKDEVIVFQNQTHLIQKWFQDCGRCPSLLEIALATDVMVDFAMKGPTKDVLKRFEKLEAYLKEQVQQSK